VSDDRVQGYMADPRATDNAWVETTVYWLHDIDGDFSNLPLVSFDSITDREPCLFFFLAAFLRS